MILWIILISAFVLLACDGIAERRRCKAFLVGDPGTPGCYGVSIAAPWWRRRWWVRCRKIPFSRWKFEHYPRGWPVAMAKLDGTVVRGWHDAGNGVTLIRSDGSQEIHLSWPHELYVPWWAWPLDVLNVLIYGSHKMLPLPNTTERVTQ